MIHPTAVVHENVKIGNGVTVGPWSVIGADVELGDNTWLGPHVVVRGPTKIGRDNRIYQFSSIGDAPQDKKYQGESSLLEIGNGNVIREFCTVNRGTDPGGGVTRVGNHNWIMAYVHVAHDCIVGDHVTAANGSTLAGHVEVGDHVTFGAFTMVHQFCAVGAHSFSAMGTVILKDVPPFVTIAGNTAEPHGINVEGLKRRNFSPEAIRELRRAYKTVYKRSLTLEQALVELQIPSEEYREVAELSQFIRRSKRGIVR